MKIKTFLILTFIISSKLVFSQTNWLDPETELNNKRLKIVATTESIGYVGSMTGLYFLWYSDYPLSKFHFFNDNHGWMGIDKFGHALTSYTVGRAGMDVLDWTGMDHKKAIWYGGGLGFMFLTSVEVFDGFSDGWGASPGDLIANTFGSALLIGQEYLWQEQRIVPKLSYSHSVYQQYNPDVLGHGFSERLLKDYNGQTHWYSFNIHSFLNETSAFPKWLNIAFGYGANGMITGYGNPTEINGVIIPKSLRVQYRQFYFSPDIDLSKIKTKSKFANTLLSTFAYIKFPMPALEYNEFDHIKFHWLFF